MKKFLKCYPKSILFYRFTETQTKDNITSTQHKLQNNTVVAMQDKAAQHWWYSTTMVANTISNTGKFAKDSGRNPHHSDSET